MTRRLPLVLLFAFTITSVCSLGWLAWRVLDQDRLVEAQRSRETLEHEADRLATLVAIRLADAGDRLVSSTEAAPGTFTLRRTDSGWINSRPLLYWPFAVPEPEAPTDIFEDAERAEFTEAQPAIALTRYEELSESPDPPIRAGALLRRARVLRSMGRHAEAAEAYVLLSRVRGMSIAGSPASLLARRALADLDPQRKAALREDLVSGVWRLTKPQFEFHWASVSTDGPPEEAAALAKAVDVAWARHGRDPDPRGEEFLTNGLVLLWRGGVEHRALLLAPPEHFVPSTPDFVVTLRDPQGRILTGPPAGKGFVAVRPPSGSLPWTLSVSAARAVTAESLAVRNRLLLSGMGVLFVFLVFGTYFVAQAIRREAQMVRLQSEFVSAVSHEFRSPLTSMRQLSELLAEGRVDDDRRERYYRTLVSETGRLQKLVEALLQFGRLDAGQYRPKMAPVECLALAYEVAAEFASQRVQVTGTESVALGDAEAVTVALRNLIDNALKYSEGEVFVSCSEDGDTTAMRVTDFGPPIEGNERRAIFQKFVRGSRARELNVKGSGIGLATVAHIATAHGGTVTIEAPGNTFVLRLRRWKAQARAAEQVKGPALP